MSTSSDLSLEIGLTWQSTEGADPLFPHLPRRQYSIRGTKSSRHAVKYILVIRFDMLVIR